MEPITQFREDYRFLSNFYQHPFEFEGLVYPNGEAAFQAQKCSTPEGRVKYTTVKNPVRAKQMGKKEPNLRPDWNEVSSEIMGRILRAKFSDPELAARLKATGNAYIEEGNHWHDNRWGRCTCEKCAGKQSLNLLGKLLMEIREEL